MTADKAPSLGDFEHDIGNVVILADIAADQAERLLNHLQSDRNDGVSKRESCYEDRLYYCVVRLANETASLKEKYLAALEAKP